MSRCFNLRGSIRYLRLAVTCLGGSILLALPAQPKPLNEAFKDALQQVEKPKLATGAPATISNPQRNALISAVKSTGAPLDSRSVFAISDNQVVRLTEANAPQILGKPSLTAERVASAVSETSSSGLLKSLGATRAFVLPTRFTTLPLNGNQPVHFGIELAVLNGLHYDSAVGKFAARIAMALVNPSNRDDSSPLTQELPVMFAADNADFTPAQIKFTALNSPLQVSLNVAAPTEPYSIAVMTSLNDTPDKLTIPIARPRIEVLSSSPRIWGFGLAQTTLTVRISEAQGGKGQNVALTASSGAINPSLLRIQDTGTATAVLRSEGTGKSTITATDPPFREGTAIVDFTFPTAFLISTLLGGLVGALLRADIRRNLLPSILVGLLAAVVLCVAYAAGVRFDAWGVPAGGTAEALFFVLGAISGFLGRKALSRLTG